MHRQAGIPPTYSSPQRTWWFIYLCLLIFIIVSYFMFSLLPSCQQTAFTLFPQGCGALLSLSSRSIMYSVYTLNWVLARSESNTPGQAYSQHHMRMYLHTTCSTYSSSIDISVYSMQHVRLLFCRTREYTTAQHLSMYDRNRIPVKCSLSGAFCCARCCKKLVLWAEMKTHYIVVDSARELVFCDRKYTVGSANYRTIS